MGFQRGSSRALAPQSQVLHCRSATIDCDDSLPNVSWSLDKPDPDMCRCERGGVSHEKNQLLRDGFENAHAISELVGEGSGRG